MVLRPIVFFWTVQVQGNLWSPQNKKLIQRETTSCVKTISGGDIAGCVTIFKQIDIVKEVLGPCMRIFKRMLGKLKSRDSQAAALIRI